VHFAMLQRLRKQVLPKSSENALSGAPFPLKAVAKAII
jgi:hypothetical protein